MNLGEAKSKAEQEGTEQTVKFRKTVRRALTVFLGVVVCLVATVWATRLVHYNNTREASAASTTTAECPGSPRGIPVTLNSEWKPLNPDGKCRIIYNFDPGTVEFMDDQGVFAGRGWQSRKPTLARSTVGTIHKKYSLCPTGRGDHPVNWDCTPL